MTELGDGLGWHFSDRVFALQEEIGRLRWWQWRKRRRLRFRAVDLAEEADRFGVDLGPLFGLEKRLRLPEAEPGSQP